MSARRLCLTAILAVTGCSYINLDYNDGATDSTATAASASAASTTSYSTSSTTSSSTSANDTNVSTTASASESTSAATSDTSTTTDAPICGDGVIDRGELCDDGDLDPADGCTPDCLPTPTKVIVGEAVKQSVHASDGAVYPYTDACPGGLVRGVRVVPEFSAYDWVAGLQVYCGAPSLAGFSITIADSGALPYRKGDEAADPEAADLICPQDQVVVSAFGSAGDVLDNLGVRCAPLVLSPTPQGYTVGAGSMTDLGPHGDGNATNFEDPCDGAMSGAYVNLGSWVNGYATLCSTIAAE